MATNYGTKPPGMPSILGDIPGPFSGTKPAGIGNDFDTAYTQWQKTKTPESNTAILKTLQPVIDTAVMSYAGQSASPTIKSRAKIMALKALDSYDPQRGNVRTHLLSQLQSLRRATAQAQNIINIPEQVSLDFSRLNESENELRDQLGRDPSDDELADSTGLSVRRIRKIRAFNQPVSEGMTTREVAGDEAYGGDVASAVPGSGNRAADAWFDFVYGDLSPVDQLIADMTLGRHGRRRASTQDIARRLNITPGAVSQRAAKIQAQLDKQYTQGGF
jgi:DNA-directed RNA polymerase specialized sigma subunit